MAAEAGSRLPFELATEVVELLTRYRFRVGSEQELQEGLWTILLARYPDAKREAILDAHNRIDFIVDRVGIEVKVDGTMTDLARQVMRYSKFEQLGAFVVVSTRAKHRSLPANIGGKPVLLAYLGDGAL